MWVGCWLGFCLGRCWLVGMVGVGSFVDVVICVLVLVVVGKLCIVVVLGLVKLNIEVRLFVIVCC